MTTDGADSTNRPTRVRFTWRVHARQAAKAGLKWPSWVVRSETMKSQGEIVLEHAAEVRTLASVCLRGTYNQVAVGRAGRFLCL